MVIINNILFNESIVKKKIKNLQRY